MKKNNSPGSLPEIVEAIDRAYDLAFSLVSRLRFAESFADRASGMATITFFPGEDEEQRIAEAIAQAKRRLFDRRNELIELRELIASDLEELREAFLGVTINVFEFAYTELGDFDEADDRSAYGVLTKLSYAVLKRLSETIGFLGHLDSFIDLHKDHHALTDDFPMNQSFERSIRKRLLFEKSILWRNAKAYAETKGIIGTETTTTPQGRKKTEKTSDQIKTEKSYLSLLAEYSKWQVAQKKKTGRERFGPDDWLEDQNRWSPKSKDFFKKLCEGKDGTASEILTNGIKYARKLSREQSSGD